MGVKLLLDLLIAVAGGLIAGEISGALRGWSRFIVRRSVRRLPVGAQERYEQEWLAELAIAQAGGVSGLYWAFNEAWLASRRLREVLVLGAREAGELAIQPELMVPPYIRMRRCLLHIEHPLLTHRRALFLTLQEIAPEAEPVAMLGETLLVANITLEQIDHVMRDLREGLGEPYSDGEPYWYVTDVLLPQPVSRPALDRGQQPPSPSPPA